MLFRSTRSRDTLQRALHAAVATRRPLVLRHMLATHGEAAFAAALSSSPVRVIADALSLLPADNREAVSRRVHQSVRVVNQGTCKANAADIGASRKTPRPLGRTQVE